MQSECSLGYADRISRECKKRQPRMAPALQDALQDRGSPSRPQRTMRGYSFLLGYDRLGHRNAAGNFRHARPRLAIHACVAGAQKQHSAIPGIAKLVRLARLEQYSVELFQHEFSMGSAHCTFSFE